jgi:hypothetical protein
MIRYTVTATIQSNNIDAGEPVDVNWYKGTSLGKAISAMSGAAAHDEDVDHGDLPEALRYRTLSVRLDKQVQPDEPLVFYGGDTDLDVDLRVTVLGDTAALSYWHVDAGTWGPGEPMTTTEPGVGGWNFETTAGLDDCIYWSRPEADCAGPRVGYRADGTTVCEHHINHPPVP